MRLENLKLHVDPSRSFIFHYETKSFSYLHHHSELELVYIIKGSGKRVIGDHIDQFYPNDLILVGSYLPHAWICNPEFSNSTEGFKGIAIVCQFNHFFLGEKFLDIPENMQLKEFLLKASRGIRFMGKEKEKIKKLMIDSYKKSQSDQLYTLLEIFNIFATAKKYVLLASSGLREPYYKEGNEPIQKAIDFIYLNFQRKVTIKEILRVTNMSNTAFCKAFKKNTRTTFQEFLLTTRIGYACKLIADGNLTISQVSSQCGFDNVSNFNRQFLKKKGLTPSQFRNQINASYR